MHIKQPDKEYFAPKYKDIFWVNPSSFKHKDIVTPYDWWYKINHPQPDTRAKTTGIMQHEYFLEREKFNSQYVFLRHDDFQYNCEKTKEGYPDMRNAANKNVKIKKEFENPSKEVVEPKDTELFMNVRDAFERINDLHYLLDDKNGYYEHSFYAFVLFDSIGKFQRFVKMDLVVYCTLSQEEKALYLPVKCRMDYIHKIKTYIIDLKVTKDILPERFKYEIEEYGYHIQASFYLDVAACIFEKQYDTFIFAVAENVEPYRSTKYLASDTMIQAGREDYIWKLEMIHKAIQEKSYPGLEIYSEIENRQIITIDLPNTYYYRKNKQIIL